MEVFNLNIIPGAVAPIIHASQYDEDREFRANLFEGDQVFELTGEETISVNVRKTDGNVVTAAVVNTGANYVDFSTTLQMTACAGANLCQLRIENSPRKIGTLNFILAVERDPLEGGIQSESEINNLETQVAGMVAEEVATQYDSANVIFDNEPTESHGIGYTVTSEGIKTAIDNAFDYDNTASGSIVHIEDGADNIPVKSLVSEIVAVESGSGEKSPENPYTISGFANGVITRCGKNLFDINALTATGITISGNSAVGSATTFFSAFSSGININIPKSSVLTLSVSGYTEANQGTNGAGVRFKIKYTDNTESILTFLNATTSELRQSITTESGKTISYIYIDYGSNGNNIWHFSNIQLEIGTTATTYEPYTSNTYTFAFGQTVYGGHFDNKGNLIVTHIMLKFSDLNFNNSNPAQHVFRGDYSGVYFSNMKFPPSSNVATEDFTERYVAMAWQPISASDNGRFALNDYGTLARFVFIDYNFSTQSDFETARANDKIIVELKNPIVLSITSQDIPTLLGENNIFSNCGDLEVNYYTNKSNDILEFIDSEIGKKNGTNIPIEEGSPDSIKDYIDNVSLSGLPDTDISGETSGQILAFDGANWVNTNQIAVKYEEKDIAFGADGEGTLFTTLTNVINVIDVTNDTNYVGYFHYFARGGAVRVKPFNRAVTGFDSSTFANTTRKVGIYYLDNIATQ